MKLHSSIDFEIDTITFKTPYNVQFGYLRLINVLELKQILNNKNEIETLKSQIEDIIKFMNSDIIPN